MTDITILTTDELKAEPYKLSQAFIDAHAEEMGLCQRKPRRFLKKYVDRCIERLALESFAAASGVTVTDEAARLLDLAIAEGNVVQIGERRILGAGGKSRVKRGAWAR